MTDDAGAPLENRVLRARAAGEVSADAAFEEIYREYARLVNAWLAVRVEQSTVDDLAQDVWLIFYSRFRNWEFGVEAESTGARPVASFLFRTCQLVARGHLRLARRRKSEPLESAGAVAAYNGQRKVVRGLDATRSLGIARRVCTEEELDVLLAKLAGMSAREIATTLSITPAVVDHRYRNALERVRKEMKLGRNDG